MGSYTPASEDSRKEVNVLVTGFGAGTPNRPDHWNYVLSTPANRSATALPYIRRKSILPDR